MAKRSAADAASLPSDDVARRDGVRYRDAGVNLDAKHGVSSLIRRQVQRTFGPRVVDVPGGFAGMFRLDSDTIFDRNYRKPMLVACCDGVGTKLIIAQMAGKLDGIGIDLVAMNVNDLICMGAEPLFFLDYVAVNAITDELMLGLIKSISDGCVEAGCALLGGETADMPDVYDKPGEFDLAGFAVGVIQGDRVVDGSTVAVGDKVIGVASSGIHSNGYSLVRKVVFERMKLKVNDPWPGVSSAGQPPAPPKRNRKQPAEPGMPTVADVLLTPTRIYVKAVRSVLRKYTVKKVVKAMAHITGGGLPNNLNRVLPKHIDAVLAPASWPVPEVFQTLQQGGPIPEDEMWQVFNMGIGYCFVVAPTFANSIMTTLRRAGYDCWEIGQTVKGTGKVRIGKE